MISLSLGYLSGETVTSKPLRKPTMNDSKSPKLSSPSPIQSALSVTALLAAFAITAPSAADAATNIWDNGLPDQVTAIVSDLDVNNTIADDFSLSSSQTITGFNWWGIYASGSGAASDDFTLYIFDNSGDDPDNIQWSENIGTPDSRTTTGNTTAGSFDEYAYGHTLTTPQTLSAGDYWLVVRNNTNQWAWSTSTANIAGTDAAGTEDDRFVGVSDLSTTSPADWTDNPNFDDQLAFEIVPEPQSYALLFGVAALGFAAVRRRKQG